jgi:tetratricopeptide (TPR) repeat protein
MNRHRLVAEKTLQALDPFVEMLAREVDPSRLALESLGVNKRGWPTTGIYNEEALKLWTQALEADPDDMDTLHHLAICHHACAIDLEGSANPGTSDTHWEAALGLWKRIWQSEQFWERFAEKNLKEKEGKAHAVSAREQLQRQLFSLHFAVAMDPETPLARARKHVALAQEWCFEASLLREVRSRAYEIWIEALPPDIWATTRPDDLKQGIDHIEKFLERDPGCEDAAKDALRLLAHFNRKRVTEANAADEMRRKLVLRETANLVKRWEPYIEQLYSADVEPENIVRDNLGTFFFVASQANYLLGENEAGARQLAIVEKWGQPQDVEQALEFKKKFVENQQLDALLKKANEAMNSGNWYAADKVWTKIIGIAADIPAFYFNRFQCRWNLDNKVLAVGDLDVALAHADERMRQKMLSSISQFADEINNVRRKGY